MKLPVAKKNVLTLWCANQEKTLQTQNKFVLQLDKLN